MTDQSPIDLYPSRFAARPERRERIDPVFHGQWHEGAPLSAEQAASFDRDGFLVLPEVFTEEEVTLLQQEAGTLLGDPATLDDETLILEPGSDEVRSIFAIHEQSALMRRLAEDQRLAGAASFLLDDEVYVHQSRLNYKPGFQGKEFYWHSDFETWHVEDGMPRMRALSISVLLAENTPNNGPLMLIPGSHRTYLSCVGETPEDHYKQSLRKQDYGVPDEYSLAELATEHGITAPVGLPGSVVIFDCNVMHGSNGNITPFPRSNAFFVFNAVSNRLVKPFGPENPRPDFIASRKVTPITPVDGPLAGADRR
ncbi:ectoine hydroxylase [Croceicoccus estronivorus]|uniref:ectoine hydroxylase n=1 Tax=Croceicoccus estronivorus TaxID=1172626 RepID=UPI00082F668A|nr:ectoine hydroxylase [Croceicoccus estronivorus]OCC22459.1 ectoine hydroxylase [Croceicoccus estronivorus]